MFIYTIKYILNHKEKKKVFTICSLFIYKNEIQHLISNKSQIYIYLSFRKNKKKHIYVYEI